MPFFNFYGGVLGPSRCSSFTPRNRHRAIRHSMFIPVSKEKFRDCSRWSPDYYRLSKRKSKFAVKNIMLSKKLDDTAGIEAKEQDRSLNIHKHFK